MTEQTKDLVLYDRAASPAIPDAQNLRALATELLGSGLYPNIKNAMQAIAVIAAGQELGLGPTASLQYISIVNGKMCAEAKVWLALFHRSGGKTKILKHDKESCRIEFSKPGYEPYISEYTHAMAVTEGLVGKGGAWAKMEETMLQWRAVSNGIRAYDPGVVMGIALTKEEVEDYPEGIAVEAPKGEEPTKKAPGRPKVAKPTPEPEKAPVSSPEAPQGPIPAQKPAPQPTPKAEKPPQTGFEAEDDIAAMAEHAESQTEEDLICAKLNAALEESGVDVKAFKEWLFARQARMHTADKSRTREFLTKWKNGALRFHGGITEDLEYLLLGIQPAIGMFRYETKPAEKE